MATKPFYSLSETQTKLGVNDAQIQQLVKEGKLQQITSQGQTHYRSADVERLATELGMGGELPAALGTPVLPDSAPLDLSGEGSPEQSKDLGLSESVGFAVPAESQVLGEEQPAGPGVENDLGSAELGLSESVGFSLAGQDKSAAPVKPPAADSQSVPLTGIPSGADRSNTPPPPPLEEGELGLSESIGFSQLDEEAAAKLPPGTELSSSGTIPAEQPDLDLSLSHNLVNEEEESKAEVPEVSLKEADKAPAGKKPGKGDTVITSAGISVFDDEDLEASAADPLAKTTIAPIVDEHQLSLEGVGSGSGLLDLTRETDDTSLDAELLDEIYPGSGQQMSISAVSSAHGSTLMDRGAGSAATSAASIAGIEQFPNVPPQVIVEYVEEVERQDPYEIAFTITLIITTLVMVMVGITSASLVSGVTPNYVKSVIESWTGFFGVSIAVAFIGLLVGLLLGRQKAKRMEAEVKFAERQAAKEAGGEKNAPLEIGTEQKPSEEPPAINEEAPASA